MEAAAKNLTPVTLELGRQKAPSSWIKTADVKLAARRIAFGKVLNAGQTCVEPDYLLIEKSVKPAFIEAYRQALHEFFPDGSMDEMPVIVSEKHFARVTALLEGQTAVVGGEFDEKNALRCAHAAGRRFAGQPRYAGGDLRADPAHAGVQPAGRSH